MVSSNSISQKIQTINVRVEHLHRKSTLILGLLSQIIPNLRLIKGVLMLQQKFRHNGWICCVKMSLFGSVFDPRRGFLIETEHYLDLFFTEFLFSVVDLD